VLRTNRRHALTRAGRKPLQLTGGVGAAGHSGFGAALQILDSLVEHVVTP
jgi:hypothetical protein